MERWTGKVAIVTGATSGIGAAIAESLVKYGLKVVGLGRRESKLQDLKSKLSQIKESNFYPIKVDLKNEDEILNAFKWTLENLGALHVLINNAGIMHTEIIRDQATEQWREMFDTNVLALEICSREAIRAMQSKNIEGGHIINISSIAAHATPFPKWTTYFATKKAVNCISDGLRKELGSLNSDIRVTIISPGLTQTELFAANRAVPDDTMKFGLLPSDIAEAIIFALQVPTRVLVREIIIEPVKCTNAEIAKANL